MHDCFLAACIICHCWVPFHVSYVCLRYLSSLLILSCFVESSSELKQTDKCSFSKETGPHVYCLTWLLDSCVLVMFFLGMLLQRFMHQTRKKWDTINRVLFSLIMKSVGGLDVICQLGSWGKKSLYTKFAKAIIQTSSCVLTSLTIY